MLKVNLKLDTNGIIEKIADHEDVETVIAEERLHGLHVVKKLFLKSKFDFSFIRKHSHLYPLCQQRGIFMSSCISHQ